MKNKYLILEKYEEHLHQKARDLMEKLDKKHNRKKVLSLDEYFLAYNHTEEEKREINNLLEEFYK